MKKHLLIGLVSVLLLGNFCPVVWGQPFFSSVGEALDEPLNEYWKIFGLGDNTGQPSATFMGGIMFWDSAETSGGCNWAESKLYWRNDPGVRAELRQRLIKIPFDQDSRYLWSTEGGRLHVSQARIISTNPELITKTWEVLRWETPEFAKEWLNTTQDYGISYTGTGGNSVELCSPSDYVRRIGDFDNSVEQTFTAKEGITEVKAKLFVTDKSIYRMTLYLRENMEPLENKVFRGTEDHADRWTRWTLAKEYPAGEYLLEIKNVAHEVLGQKMTWQNPAYYWHPVGWFASEFDAYPEGVGGMNGWLGETPWERLRANMEYMLADNGSTKVENGLTIITWPTQTGVPVPPDLAAVDTERDNRESVSLPSTYYDLIRTGYKEAFVNIRWREAYYAMMMLEKHFGDENKAEEYRQLFLKATETFCKTFWNPETGRYAGWIDIEGNVWDFGEVAINLKAIVTNHRAVKLGGVPHQEEMFAQHRSIMDWIEGRRIIPGDDSQGEDIYFFGFAPRKNTLGYESIGLEKNHWWGAWYYDLLPDGTGMGNFGYQEENGGTNPYITYYDVMARLALAEESATPQERQAMINNAWNRFYVADNSLIKEFAKDKLFRPTEHPPHKSHPDDRYQVYVMKLPESGLPAKAVIDGFLGVDAAPEALTVTPMLPDGVDSLGVKDVLFQGKTYTIKAEKDRGQAFLQDTN